MVLKPFRSQVSEVRSVKPARFTNRAHTLIPVCAWCNRVRDNEGNWHQNSVPFQADKQTHTICPDCSRLYDAFLVD